jgi:hypothetical protein
MPWHRAADGGAMNRCFITLPTPPVSRRGMERRARLCVSVSLWLFSPVAIPVRGDSRDAASSARPGGSPTRFTWSNGWPAPHFGRLPRFPYPSPRLW